MPYTSPATAVTGNIITAAFWNTSGRDNLNYHQGLLDGTGSGTVTHPGGLVLNNDSVNNLTKNGANPIWFMDTLDSFQYNRATNEWWFAVGGTVILTIDSTGKLTGGSFYESTPTSVANTVNQGFTHGLGVQPRWVGAWYGTTGAGNQQNPAVVSAVNIAGMVRVQAADSTTISVVNNVGSTQFVRVVAIK